MAKDNGTELAVPPPVQAKDLFPADLRLLEQVIKTAVFPGVLIIAADDRSSRCAFI
jgi:hypothetical protein